MSTTGAKLHGIVGVLMLAAGAAVFAIRLQHAGPYDWPEGGNLAAGLLALALGALLVGTRAGAAGPALWLGRAALVAVLPVLFFALYAVLAEVEEVIVLHATDSQGRAAPLRLWVIDVDGDPWVTMPAAKADEHRLDGARVDMLRAGETQCVRPERSDAREDVERVFRARYGKYRAQRLATAVGLFGRSPSPESVTLRLAPCEASGPA